MFWLLVLSTVFLGIGVIVFVLTRDSFHASRARREFPLTAFPMQESGDAMTINTIMQKTVDAPPPPNPATLFCAQSGKETDAFADTLAKVKGNPMLPATPKAYLRLEELDDSLDHLLVRHIPGQREASQTPPREFAITVTEKPDNNNGYKEAHEQRSG
jgi:hypothetical protein